MAIRRTIRTSPQPEKSTPGWLRPSFRPAKIFFFQKVVCLKIRNEILLQTLPLAALRCRVK